MKIIDTKINDVKIIEPFIFNDNRGYFFEAWNKKNYKASGINCEWIQDNESHSSFGVLRGLHYQIAPYIQAKLVRVIKGKVLDVAVDIRKDSQTFGKYVAVELSDENTRQLYIPRGFAHGFIVLSKEAIFSYKCDNEYNKLSERGIMYDDLTLNIDWKLPSNFWVLSEKDMKHDSFFSAEYL